MRVNLVIYMINLTKENRRESLLINCQLCSSRPVSICEEVTGSLEKILLISQTEIPTPAGISADAANRTLGAPGAPGTLGTLGTRPASLRLLSCYETPHCSVGLH